MPPKSRKSISSKPVDTPDEETSPPPLPSTIVDTPLRRRKSTRGGKAEEVEDKDEEEVDVGKKRKAPASARKTVKRGRKEDDKRRRMRKRTRKDVDEEEEKADEDEGEGESDEIKESAKKLRRKTRQKRRVRTTSVDESTDEPMASTQKLKSQRDVPEETNDAQSEDAHEADDAEDIPDQAQEEDNDEDDDGLNLPTSIRSNSNLADRLKKLKNSTDATRTENRKDVYTEFQAQKKNPRDEIRQDRLKRAADILQQKQHAEENGLDYDRIRAMTYSVQDVERYEKKERQRAKKADTGFTDYAQVAAKKYKKSRTAEELGTRVGGESDGFYRDANSLAYAAQAKPNPKAVEKLVKIVEKDAEKRKTFSRRRRHNEDDDVTYINERNMRFNRKIARAYDKHTADIRAAFERGTAL
ncbi:SYF2 splicing factor-domain-containing protein [Chytridium lagenaria]|nr:SYF2 splicing factor-domain-containing protein [Chytridium lagenaria]